MRNNIVSVGAGELKYEIREIVGIAKKFSERGLQIIWENIGDPVQKGEKIPDWIKGIIIAANRDDDSYAYSPTKGFETTREFLAQRANANGQTNANALRIVTKSVLLPHIINALRYIDVSIYFAFVLG